MKKITSSKKLLIFLVIVALAAMAGARGVFAAITGKISGVVTSEETKEPLANVKVTIVGTSYTTVTNKNGYYVMTDIPPGSYDVTVELIGYRSATASGAKVFADLTTTLDFALATAVIEIPGVTVTATKPLIKKDVTQTTKIIESEDIAAMPRDTVNSIIATQAGASVQNSDGTLHIRGGRSMEIKYLLDGIPINDPINRNLGVRVNTKALEQMEVITGGFNAEYGDAQSGVINLITKQGTRDFSGIFKYRFGVWSQHHGDPLYSPWRDPDSSFRPEALEPFRGIFLGKPYDYQKPYRGQDVTVEELAKREEGDKVVFKEIVPGVYVDRTENPLVEVIDPETGKPKIDPVSGEVIKERQPYKDTDGTIIDYEKKQVTLLDGYVVDLNQYSGLFNDKKEYDLSPGHIGEFALSGPIWGNRLTFSLASELRRDESYLPSNDTEGQSLQGKLKFELTPKVKLIASGLYDSSKRNYYGGLGGFGQYGNDMRFLPDSIPVGKSAGRSLSLQLSHHINSGTFYAVTLGQFYNSFAMNQPDKNWDPLDKTFDENIWDPKKSPEENKKAGRIENPLKLAYNDTNYAIAGDYNIWTDRNSTVSVLKSEFTSQVTENHQIKAGAELSTNQMYNLGTTNWGSSNLYVEYYDVTPKYISLYAQDKMEYAGMIVNVGLRYDGYDPDGVSPKDPLDPLELNPDGTIKLDKSVYKVGLPIIKNPVESSVKHMLAPRLGISYPITEKNKMHFTYGHYFQIPEGDDLYQNLSFDMRGAIRSKGNPDLKPEKTISYEVGVEHQFTKDLTIDVTGFTKDIDNLVDSVHVDITNDYSYFRNGIYGRVQGFELTLRKWRTEKGRFAGMLSYTYSVAKGKGSSRNLGYLTYYRQQPEVTESHPLDWDQRHVVSALMDVQLPFGFDINAIGQYGSGLPYTPNPNAPIKPAINSKRYPATYNFDLTISKRFKVSGMTYSVFTDIRNVFNNRNLYDIIDAVTYDRYGVPLNDKKHSDPLSWSSPRRIMFGVSLDF